MKILLLGGGTSSEREISLRSSAAVQTALEDIGHQVEFIDPALGEGAVRAGATRNDLIIPMLHGTGGEDGTIQRLLDSTGKPYLGSGAAASALCFNKAKLKEVLVKHHILTPKGQVVTARTFAESELIKAPFVLKPVSDGSSVGTMLARQLPYSREQAAGLLGRYDEMLLEELISGIEITVPVLGETALPVIEIIPPAGKDFDYENKYNGATSELCPPLHVSAELQARAQRLAETVHRVSGARHISRTDMIITSAGKIYVLEINTMPGMTATSLLPKSAAAAGMDWKALAVRLVELALS